MEHHDLIVVIDEKGNVTFEVQGVKGKGCLEITADFEESLGNVLDRKMKSEYYINNEESSRNIKIKK